MSLRERFARQHPEFPLLTTDDVEGLSRFLEERGWLEEGEAVRGCTRAGEGNMNLTLRVETDRREVVLKQARPWVEKYDHIEAPPDRLFYEARFYETARSIPELSRRMPDLLAFDAEARALLLEFLPEARDLTPVYGGEPIDEETIAELGSYLRALHSSTRGSSDPRMANREMRALNHQHIFLVPLDPENGLPLDDFEPGLGDAARRLREDHAFGERVLALGERYLADGPCLVHGDYFPGSWLESAAGLRIIDAEFCFYGPPEFDLGVATAHLVLARQAPRVGRLFLEEAGDPAEPPDEMLVARFAAVEIVRRLIGVAQLPLPRIEPGGPGFRSPLLDRARQAMRDGRLEPLWAPFPGS